MTKKKIDVEEIISDIKKYQLDYKQLVFVLGIFIDRAEEVPQIQGLKNGP